MGELSVSARLTYAGLWCLADDAGFFETRVPEIAGELFRWDSRKAREKRVTDALAALVEKERVQLLDCGEHGIVPTIVEHRFAGGEMLFTIRKQHDARCVSVGLRRKTEPDAPRSKRPDSGGLRRTNHSESLSSSDSSREGVIQPARAHETPTNGHARSGSNDPERREEAIARARAKLADPSSSDDMKRAAQFALDQLGAT